MSYVYDKQHQEYKQPPTHKLIGRVCEKKHAVRKLYKYFDICYNLYESYIFQIN